MSTIEENTTTNNFISCRFEMHNIEKVLSKINHNFRLTAAGNKNVVAGKEHLEWEIVDEKLVKLQNNVVHKKDIQQKWIEKSRKDLEETKAFVNDKSNKINQTKSKILRWGNLKHDTFGDAIVTFGKDFDLRDKSESEILQISLQAKLNMENFFVSIGAEKPTGFVLHAGEKGLPHFHFQFRNTVLKTGRAIAWRPGDLFSKAQDAIAENMEQFGLRRGIKGNNARHLNTFEYQKHMDQMKVYEDKIQDMELKAADMNAKVALLEADAETMDLVIQGVSTDLDLNGQLIDRQRALGIEVNDAKRDKLVEKVAYLIEKRDLKGLARAQKQIDKVNIAIGKTIKKVMTPGGMVVERAKNQHQGQVRTQSRKPERLQSVEQIIGDDDQIKESWVFLLGLFSEDMALNQLEIETLIYGHGLDVSLEGKHILEELANL